MMKVVLDFLKLQQAVFDGLTEEQVKEKLDYLKTLDERENISEDEFFRETCSLEKKNRSN
ncbi:hypothetical protein [Erwinia amylovora]|uniref:hypothetical protein n=1 Tax=Erwinia amylovora TaxID=552 RepID=UPI001443C80D|nr:hypothetical protein [Erwinia amylovora]